MKKSLYIGLAAILGLIGCARNQEIDIQENGLTLFAMTESPAESRTVVESGTHVYWEPGDEIAVFMGEKSAKFTTDITVSSASATFKGTFGDTAWPEELDLWAVYPFSEEAVYDGETIMTVLPSEQIAREDSFGKDMNLSIAHSNSSTLQFYNVGGGIRFSVTEEGIKKVMFEGLSGEIISGKVKIGFEGGFPVVKEVTRGSQFITLLPPAGKETFEKDTWYYIIAIPGALEGGYKLRFYKDSDYARKVSEKAVEIKRSIFGNIEKADEGIEYEALTTHFPETEEDIKESISISNEISEAIESIQLPLTAEGTVDIHQFKSEITKIEGVLSCEVGDGNRLLIVQQIDSSFINVVVDPVFHPENDESIFPDEIQSFLSQNMASMNRSQRVFPTNKKAVLLAPFNSTGDTEIPANAFVIEGFLNCVGISLKTYPDDKADLEAFSLENLSQYDLIIIKTHGLSGARTVKGDVSTILETGESVGLINRLLPSYSKFAKCIIRFSDGSVAHKYCLTVPWLEEQATSGVKLPNSYVWAGACQSFMADDLKQCFFDVGASAFSGFKETVSTGINGFALHRILNLMAFGAGLRYASDFYISNLKDATTMRTYLTEDGEDSPTYDHLLYDYRFNTEKDIDDYYLIDSTPHHLGHAPFDNSGNTSKELLFWNIDRPSTYTGIPYLYYRPGGVTPIDLPVLYLTTQFDVYIDGNKYQTTEDFSICIDKNDFTVDEHHWYVVTRIMNGNEVCATFQSAEGRFTVEKEPLTNSILYYTSTDGDIVTPNDPDCFDVSILSNEYVDGKGIITFDGILTRVGQAAFRDCSRLKSIDLVQTKVDTIDVAAFDSCTQLESVAFPTELLTIRVAAFRNCSKIVNVNIPASVNCIEAAAFSECSSLESIMIPPNVTIIQWASFEGCTSLSSISYSGYIDRIEGYAFAQCANLKSFIIPETITKIEESTFWDCTSLTSIVIPSNISTIEESAFYGCENLSYIDVLPLNPPTGGDNMFYATNNCPIYVPSGCVSVYKKAEFWRDYADRIQSREEPSSSIPEAIDLGLSVKWASFNLGASRPEESGDYYAWGETEPYYSSQDPLTWKEGKDSGYNWSSYKWCMGSSFTLTKYCNDSESGNNGFTDTKTVLDLEDDAANVNLGSSWRMPTDEEWTELRNNCTWTWTKQNGVNGRLVTAPNGKSIFLPAAGYWQVVANYHAGSNGFYWSSSLNTDYPGNAWSVYFSSGYVDRGGGNRRNNGFSVRPVYVE